MRKLWSNNHHSCIYITLYYEYWTFNCMIMLRSPACIHDFDRINNGLMAKAMAFFHILMQRVVLFECDREWKWHFIYTHLYSLVMANCFSFVGFCFCLESCRSTTIHFSAATIQCKAAHYVYDNVHIIGEHPRWTRVITENSVATWFMVLKAWLQHE